MLFASFLPSESSMTDFAVDQCYLECLICADALRLEKDSLLLIKKAFWISNFMFKAKQISLSFSSTLRNYHLDLCQIIKNMVFLVLLLKMLYVFYIPIRSYIYFFFSNLVTSCSKVVSFQFILIKGAGIQKKKKDQRTNDFTMTYHASIYVIHTNSKTYGHS